MIFSVLLPTRNGGALLRRCMHSILDQNCNEMELIVYDNANTDQTADVVESFMSDGRVKYFRTINVVTVTQNWNNALRESTGEYILMVGDDDYLLPGYFKTMHKIINRYKRPDAITCNGYAFVYPNTDGVKEQNDSYYFDPHFKYEAMFDKEFVIPVNTLRKIAFDMFRFKVRFPLNAMPHLWSRNAIETVEGELFQPPFPDHYALNSLLLKTERWVYIPEKLYIVGISPKSYGKFAQNITELNAGDEYLGIQTDFEGMIPGSSLINNMHIWLSLLKRSYPKQLEGVTISRPHYVRHQLYYWITSLMKREIDILKLLGLISKLRLFDVVYASLTVFDIASWKSLSTLFRSSYHGVRTTRLGPLKSYVNAKNPEELYEKYLPGSN